MYNINLGGVFVLFFIIGLVLASIIYIPFLIFGFSKSDCHSIEENKLLIKEIEKRQIIIEHKLSDKNLQKDSVLLEINENNKMILKELNTIENKLNDL